MTPVAWGLLFIVGLLRLKIEYLPIVIAALAMSGANILGYTKCSNNAKSKLQQMQDQGGQKNSFFSGADGSVQNYLISYLVNASNVSSGSEAPTNSV